MRINKNKLKILFLINTQTSYQDDFFSELKKYANISVIFYDSNYKNYEFKIKNKNKNYHFLDQSINPSKYLIDIVKKINPDFTVIGGYRLPYISKLQNLFKLSKKKYFFWLERLNNKSKFKIKIISFLIKYRIKKSNGILAVGNEAQNFYKNFHSNVVNLPYSISVPNKIRKNYFYNKKINFTFVGQIIKRKGIDFILDSFNSLQDREKQKIKLTIVGNGSMEKEISTIIKKNNFIKHFKFLNKGKLSKIYQKSDVFLFPSRFDGWGVAPLEAMSYSNYLILSKNIGMKEI
jgi:glycosyltransferase involved in cell wall biosynthesis